MSGLPTMRAKLAATAHDFWRARQPRERHILGIGAAILLLLLIWLSLIAPAIEGRSRWQHTLPTLHSQLAQMRAMASEIVASSPRVTSAAPVADMSPAALERSLKDKGLQAQNLTVSDNRVSAKFSNVPFAALAEWLQLIQSSAQLVVTEANIIARDLPGRVDAQLTLQRAQ
jgi:general secretion pathway protein M